MTVSWGKAEKVAFIQTTIVVTPLHLEGEIEIFYCTVCKDKAESLFSLFPKDIFPPSS